VDFSTLLWEGFFFLQWNSFSLKNDEELCLGYLMEEAKHKLVVMVAEDYRSRKRISRIIQAT
jgi:hypothetical protein